MSSYLEKVTAFITRSQGADLLLLQHPTAGLQLPAGTVEEGETPEQAVLREVREETGLETARPSDRPGGGYYDAGVRLVQLIGLLDHNLPASQRVVLRRTPVYSRPAGDSSAWAEFRRGIQVEVLRHANGFTQASYSEPDRYPPALEREEPVYPTYQITGWVPEEALCGATRRYLYHLELVGAARNQRSAAPERWSVYAGGQIFQLFWAPFSNLPELVYPQNIILAYVQKELDYHF